MTPKKTDSQNIDNQDYNITMWGPTGSGKDWLISSFVKELYDYNHDGQPLFFSLLRWDPGGGNPQPVQPEPPIHTSGTTGIIQTRYLFKREATAPGDRAQRISSHSHALILNNNKGADLIGALNNAAEFDTTYNMLLNARNLILVLSIPEEERLREREQTSSGPQPQAESRSEPAPETLSLEENPNWSRKTYLTFMQMLLERFEDGKRRNLAVCMSKADQLNYAGKPWLMLEYRYGRSMVNLLQRYQQSHNIQVFATTSAGYIHQNNKWVPNIAGGSLIDPERWKPVNTAQPFFWIFETIEKERLKQGFFLFRTQDQKIYIRYPEAAYI